MKVLSWVKVPEEYGVTRNGERKEYLEVIRCCGIRPEEMVG
jgi:hypothetical protein